MYSGVTWRHLESIVAPTRLQAGLGLRRQVILLCSTKPNTGGLIVRVTRRTFITTIDLARSE
jgi:hypothetical protein